MGTPLRVAGNPPPAVHDPAALGMKEKEESTGRASAAWHSGHGQRLWEE
jgi:hypothetical protein